MNKFYKVPEARLRELVATEADLVSLEAHGVDNWSGYGDVEWSSEEEDVSLSEFEELSL
jgi:hypothetical protein